MSTFLLMSGTSCDTSLWDDVRVALSQHHRVNPESVHAVQLLGHGPDTSHAVSFEDCLRDVLHRLAARDLRDLVIVAHGWTGAIATAIAHQAAHRVSQIIYVDAVIPDQGQRILDLLPTPIVGLMEDCVREGSVLLPLEPWWHVYANTLTKAEAATLHQRHWPQPLTPWQDRTPIGPYLTPDIALSYIHCTNSGFLPLANREAMTARLERYQRLEIPGAAHLVMATAPVLLAEQIAKAS